MQLRIILDTIFIVSVFIFPWWLSAMFGAALAFRFPKFFELVVGGLLIDLFYGASVAHFTYLFTIGAIGMLLLIEFIRTRLRIFQ